VSWNDAGQLSSVTTTGTGAGTTSYVYDASGGLLLQTDPGTVTLYLPDEQIVQSTATGATSGTRYYSIRGVTVAARASAGTVTYLTGDQQGTASVAIDSATLAVTRYYDPDGNPVGAAPSSWPGTKGFVGGTADPATGLTNLGAREYNPGTASFISPDSIITPYDPPDLNPYIYAADSPATDSDPTGLVYGPGTGPNPCAMDQQNCPPPPPAPPPPRTRARRPGAHRAARHPLHPRALPGPGTRRRPGHLRRPCLHPAPGQHWRTHLHYC
jgi:RHS repeat-associated protein